MKIQGQKFMHDFILERFGTDTEDKDEIIDLLINEIDQLENPSHCKNCNSCGDSGCCQPECMYGEIHKTDYQELLKEHDEMYKMLLKIRKHLRSHVDQLHVETLKLLNEIDNMDIDIVKE